jgi:hypothetical protein
MNTKENFKSICSVTDLAPKLGLSRARFYQLQKTGIFPPPVYCIRTKRPFYPIDLQERCLEIRETGIGNNGTPIMFYSKRDATVAKPKNRSEQKFRELSDALKEMGLKTSPVKAREAFLVLYPDNWKEVNVNGEIIAKVFRYLQNAL